jgi:hypothetical protein
MASMNDDRSSLEADITILKNFVNSDTVDELLKLDYCARIRELEAIVDDLVSPYQTLNVAEWTESHRGLFSGGTDGTEISRSTLPKVGGTQSGGKRRRIEQKDFVLIRQPLFQEYEHNIFNDQAQNFLGLTGPQGFGKSVFLHYLATKRAFDGAHIVVFVPVVFTALISFKEALGRAFYRGCAAQKLANIPFVKKSDTVLASLSRMRKFAFDRQKTLVIIVDQLKLSLEYFAETVNSMQSFAADAAADGHVVILSSSTSGRAGNVFGDHCNYLTPFSNPLLQSEVDLIVATFEEAPSNSAFARESRTSFLQTMAILSGNENSVGGLADRFVNSLFSRLRVVDPALASDIRAEHMRVLTTVVANDEYDTSLACSFDPELVDGDKFFAWETPASKFTMRESMHGFASMVLALIKQREDIKYDQFLLSIVGTPSFQRLARGAQGIILEDCFGVIMQDEHKSVKFLLTRLSGKIGAGIRTVTVDKDKKFVFHCDSAPPAAITGWDFKNNVRFVGFPGRGNTGNDFLLAWVVTTKKGRTLHVVFLRCTIQKPEQHNIALSSHYGQWVTLLQEAANDGATRKNRIEAQNTKKYMVFLTPRIGVGRRPTICAFPEEECLFSAFKKVDGHHPLLEKIKLACNLDSEWD